MERNSVWLEPRLGCITCKHVLDDGRDVNFVSHCGSDWLLLCCEETHASDESVDDLSAVHIAHVAGRGPSLHRLSSLPSNRCAVRPDKASPWKIEQDVEDGWYPEENDIVGLDKSELGELASRGSQTPIYYLRRGDGAYATVTFDTGLSAVPVWFSRQAAERIVVERWPRDSVIEDTTIGFLDQVVNELGDDAWITIDFLVGPHFRVAMAAEVRALL